MVDERRIAWVQAALKAAKLDAVVCALPVHVLLLTGYWPVLGTSLAVATADGGLGLIVPEDELELTGNGRFDHLLTFPTGLPDRIAPVSELVCPPLKQMLQILGCTRGHIGYEMGDIAQPATYVSMHLYGSTIQRVLKQAAEAAQHVPADEVLSRLLAVKTPREIEHIAIACRIAERAFHLGSERLQSGVSEAEAAMNFRLWLSTWRDNPVKVERADGFVFCMSGPNAAEAYRPYQRSRNRLLREGDTVVIQCNNYADGYWTDIVRTYCIGPPDERCRRMYEAVFAARQAALEAARPGARAADLYHVMHRTLDRHGFRHPAPAVITSAVIAPAVSTPAVGPPAASLPAVNASATRTPATGSSAATVGDRSPAARGPMIGGHGVGFHAIHHNARPIIHPASDDVLEVGMVLSLAPAVYVEGVGGVRHCDMIAISEAGHDLLTPFQTHPAALQVIGGAY